MGKHTSIMLLAAGLLIISLLSFQASAEVVYDNTTYGLDVNVSDQAKIDNRFYFGTVTSPGRSERTVIVPATFGEQVTASVTFSGEMADWITTKSYIALLQPYSRLRVTIILNVPPDAPLGVHTADMRIVYTKAGAAAGEGNGEGAACTEACSGCKNADTCLPYGIRLNTDGSDMFCDITGSLKAQLPLNTACQNSYECLSNSCGDGKCISAEEKLTFFQKIGNWFRNLFGGK